MKYTLEDIDKIDIDDNKKKYSVKLTGTENYEDITEEEKDSLLEALQEKDCSINKVDMGFKELNEEMPLSFEWKIEATE